jgi:hypothetical protein
MSDQDVTDTEISKSALVKKAEGIPRLLHVIWIGPHLIPQELIDSTAKKHVNGWLFKLWTDERGWENQAKIDCMHELNGKADLMRLEILHKHGGIAVDADAMCLRSLDEGPEDFLGNDRAFLFFEHEDLRPGLLSCAVMGAPKGSPFFRECIDRAAKADMSKAAWTVTGPKLVTEVARDMPGAVRIYPSKWVNPKYHTGVAAPGAASVKPYYDHRWGGTRGYGSLRPMACGCPLCRNTMLFPTWG